VGHYDSGRFEYFKEQYEKLGTFITKTDEPLRILDIGCGSGIEYAYIWEKAPNAHITGVDLSEGMLNALAAKYADRKEQWASFKESYFEYKYPGIPLTLLYRTRRCITFYRSRSCRYIRIY
jgi:trans-aconitate methyltransferase